MKCAATDVSSFFLIIYYLYIVLLRDLDQKHKTTDVNSICILKNFFLTINFDGKDSTTDVTRYCKTRSEFLPQRHFIEFLRIHLPLQMFLPTEIVRE